MKEKKIIRYRIPISRTFPATHPRTGQQTFFVQKIEKVLGMKYLDVLMEILKLHTIRANYPLWVKRFEKIHRGEAVLEPYYWTGKPYRSKSITIFQLGKDDGVGIQKLEFHRSDLEFPSIDGWQGGAFES